MILQIQKHIKKATFILIIFIFFLSFDVYAQEEGKCEGALVRCLIDAVSFLPSFSPFYKHIIYCLGGYIFCIKYLKN